MLPSSPSSPMIRYFSSPGRARCSEAAMIPRAMGTSYPLPCLCRSAGARLMTIFLPGMRNPFACRAVTVRKRLSFTAASASPTRWIPIPRVISTSTVTGTASIPTHFAPCTYTSIFLFCPNLQITPGNGGKKRKNVAKCFGLFQRKVQKRPLGEPRGWFKR